jgi:hypothetical protein
MASPMVENDGEDTMVFAMWIEALCPVPDQAREKASTLSTGFRESETEVLF